MATVLSVDMLWKGYAAGVRGCSIRAWILRGCALRVSLGERLAIVGPPACGKSTLLACLAGELRPDAGSVERRIPVIRADGRAAVLQLDPVLSLIDDDPAALEGLRYGHTAIVVSRDLARVRRFVDRILVLEDGRLTALTHVAVRRVAESARPRAAPLQGRRDMP